MMPAAAPALRVHDLTVRFGGLVALKGVSLAVRLGARHGVLGPNGAGKTTLFNAIAGFVRPESGAVWVEETEVTHLPPHRRVALGLARTFQITTLLPQITALDNVLLGALVRLGRHRDPWREARRHPAAVDLARALLADLGLEPLAGTRVADLGYGEQRQLEIAVALALGPKILLLDEPTAGLSAAETRAVVDLVRRLPADLTLVIIEHDLEVVFRLADHLTVLHNGACIADGPAAEVRDDPLVREVYLGGR